MSERRDNSGTLGKNKRRQHDKQPTHTGRATIAGVEYWVDAWVKDGNDGERFFSLAFKPKEATTSSNAPATKPAEPARPAQSGAADFDDDIPF